MKISLIQMDMVLGDVQANQKKALMMMEKAVAQGAKLIALPEMWTTGYKLEEIHKLGEPDTGESIQLLQDFAQKHQVEVMAGSIAELREGKVYNTAYAIDSRGQVIAKYSKMHLIGLMEEDQFIAPGTEKVTFPMSFGKAGLIICYDLRFVELPRALALAGCQALFVPAEWPSIRGEHWRILNRARAIENQMFVICINRVGRDRSNEFYGHSMVIDPWGQVLAEGTEQEEVITVEVDFGSVLEVREKMPIFADRRPQYY